MAYPKDFTDLSYPQNDDCITMPGTQDRDAFAARVSGDSMEPMFSTGDIVIFSPAAAPRNGDDCFVRFDDGQTTFKRVFFEADGKGKSEIRLQPRNHKHRPQIVSSERITGMWKAMFKYVAIDSHAEAAPASAPKPKRKGK
jgi:phage repressor protein C with HTH and peptisase S24 domain